MSVLAAAVVLASGALVATPTAYAVESVVAAPAAPTEQAAPAARAANTADFNPGYIISDALFYDDLSMTAAQIQGFLDSKIGSCSNGACLNVGVVNFPGRSIYISSRTGKVVCNAVAGGTMKISELIYRTQMACGISAKVILVTLQKEQGLVTSRAPSASALSHAMGMACPDTAPCDPGYAGLATQIVTGTAQLMCYKMCNFAKQPGSQYIQYHPNAGCGGTTFVVQNYATAALYSYTPYQPNAAALANPYGTGNGCSSYGNRNFWTFYNDWFGTSIGGSPTDAINSLYLVLGGETGSLGAVVESPACASNASTCLWTYQHGVISFSRRSGSIASSGTLGDYWLANRAIAGLPTAPETPVDDPHGNGWAQAFEGGVVHSSVVGTYLVPNNMMSAYSAAGWLRGPIGWPTSAPVCGGPSGGCVQTFQGGTASQTAAGAGSFMRTDVVNLYTSLGGPTGSLGYPIATQTDVSDANGNGVVQAFDAGLVHASSRGAFVVPNAVMHAYSAEGWVRGSLGWPTGAYTCDATGCTQPFAGGSIRTATDGSGGFVAPTVDPALQAAYTAVGGATGPLGYPTALRTVITDPNGNGIAQAFQGGIIHAGPPGAFPVSNAAMTAYSGAGWLRGRLGWPTAAAVCDVAGCTQEFTGGTIVVRAGQAGFVTARIEAGPILDLYTTSGGASGALGRAVAIQTIVTDPNGNGVAQQFQNGIVHSSVAGAFFVPTSVMTAYSAKGWVRGSLGWPTGVATCDAGGCVQTFQRGTIDTH